ncbi:MAG TPA: disulfide bond formation protein B [Parvularculaceae bacterium]|nr:disulfide bond formation protein B [Parvularculaceae bacterium]HNS87890.1 disulfide bond formation protein B [Parvularculaceae bacterium]
MLTALENRTLIEKSLIASASASGALLIGAHLFEHVGGLAPCALCLDQREAHWTGLALAVIGIVGAIALRWRRAAIATVGACALVYLVSAGLALYHAGVENHYWPGPATCSGGGPVDVGPGGLADILNQKPGAPSCSEAAWRFLGVSMAGYNLLISAGLFAFCLIAAAAAVREERRSARGLRAQGGVAS